jgi:hypothetical protein
VFALAGFDTAPWWCFTILFALPSRRVWRQFDAVKSPTVQLWYASNADPRCFKIVFAFPRGFFFLIF